MEDKIPIILSNSSQFKISKECKEYLENNGIDHEFYESDNVYYPDEFGEYDLRTNSIFINYLFSERSKITDPNLRLEYIPNEYYVNDCYEIVEGLFREKLFLDKKKLNNVYIKKIIFSEELNDTEKINKLKEIICI